MTALAELRLIRWGLVAGGGASLLLGALALVSLVWVPFPLAGPPLSPLSEPGGPHLLGTDQAGRDMVSLLMTAALSSLAVAGFGTLIALLVGLPAGALAAARLGPCPRPVRVSALMLAPALVVAMLLAALGSAGPGIAILAMAGPGAVASALSVWGPVDALLGRDYVAAARIAGLTALPTMQRHVLPALLPLVAALGLELFAVAILIEASLGFLGLAAGTGGTGLGVLLREAQGFMQIRPLLAIAPGVTIVTLIVALQLAARGLRQGIDGSPA